jgi:hypothetical protein
VAQLYSLGGYARMKTIVVKVPKAADDYSLVSDLRNVAEEIYREFSPAGVAQVPEMDSATTELRIFIPASRHLGVVSTSLKKALRRYRLTEVAELSRQDHLEPPAR